MIRWQGRCGGGRQVAVIAAERAAKVLPLAPDILVMKVGVQGPAGPLAAVTLAGFSAGMAVNLQPALTLTAGLMPPMAGQAGSGKLMSSIAGLRGKGAIGLYGLTKAALAQLAGNLAVEWGDRGCG